MASSRLDLLKVEGEAIPREPTRAEELAYLDRLEVELRTQPIKNTPPDPAREARAALQVELDEMRRDYFRKWMLGGLLAAPVSLWLTRRTRYHSAGGIPMRSYPHQHSVRFWTFFFLYDFTLSVAFAITTVEKHPFPKHEYYLYETRKRHL